METLAPARRFYAMHERQDPSDPLVVPNVWDAVSARAFADAGFPVLATSSAAVAATLGYRDGGHTPPAEMFAAIARIVRSVSVPVTADIEHGYGLAPPGTRRPPSRHRSRRLQPGGLGPPDRRPQGRRTAR